MNGIRHLAAVVVLLAWPAALFAANGPTVHVDPSPPRGPHPLRQETASAVIHDYLDSWKSMAAALQQNRAGLLDRDFVGVARDKLADTVHQQASAGIRTHYRDLSHDIQIVFYSPEGLSVQLVDTVVYDEQVMTGGKPLAKKRMTARYIAVLTPTAATWKVRMLQASSKMGR
jgi:hypothetical protein